MSKCVPGIETSIGTIYPFETERSYHDAVSFCKEKHQTLASLHDVEVLKIVSDYIIKCFKVKHRGWAVGLYFNKHENAKGWHDGTQFDYNLHGKFFINNDNTHESCRYPKLKPEKNKTVIYDGSCHGRSFFCMKKAETTTLEQTTVYGAGSGNNDKYSAVVQNSPAIAVAIFLVILLVAGACFMKSGRTKPSARKARKNENKEISKTLTDNNYDDINTASNKTNKKANIGVYQSTEQSQESPYLTSKTYERQQLPYLTPKSYEQQEPAYLNPISSNQNPYLQPISSNQNPYLQPINSNHNPYLQPNDYDSVCGEQLPDCVYEECD